MAITNVFNNYFPRDNKYYSFINLFKEKAKSIYDRLVLVKMKLKHDNNGVDVKKDGNESLEDTINDLLINKFTKREKVKYELNKQTQIMLDIFGIEKAHNQHILSSFYLKINENKDKINKEIKKNNIINTDEIQFDL